LRGSPWPILSLVAAALNLKSTRWTSFPVSPPSPCSKHYSVLNLRRPSFELCPCHLSALSFANPTGKIEGSFWRPCPRVRANQTPFTSSSKISQASRRRTKRSSILDRLPSYGVSSDNMDRDRDLLPQQQCGVHFVAFSFPSHLTILSRQ
jgi:hypothetical protein